MAPVKLQRPDNKRLYEMIDLLIKDIYYQTQKYKA